MNEFGAYFGGNGIEQSEQSVIPTWCLKKLSRSRNSESQPLRILNTLFARVMERGHEIISSNSTNRNHVHLYCTE